MTNGLRVEVTISVVPVSPFGLTVEAKRKALQASAEVSPGYLIGTQRSRDQVVSDGVRDCIGKLSETGAQRARVVARGAAVKGTLREARELLTELRGLLREVADANDPTLGSFDRFTDAIADIKRKAPHLRREIDKWLQAAP